MKEKVRFILIGSGWRALYYIRIAKALRERFECLAVLCRSEEKKERLEAEYGIHAVCREEECLALHPDFAVIAVDKAHMNKTAMHWAEYLPVLMETPAGTSKEELDRMTSLSLSGAVISSAEQYRYYASNAAKSFLIESGLLGVPHVLYLSYAHEYHAVSLMRSWLNLPWDMPFEVSAMSFDFPTAQTLTRTDRFTDGRLAVKKRTLAVFRFENGTVCAYDFDNEQYRSLIRTTVIRVQGSRGELMNETVRWLDERNEPQKESMIIEKRTVHTDSTNPNLREFQEITGIEWQKKKIYEPPYGPAGLSEDETALAVVLEKMGAYAKGSGEPPYSLKEAIADAGAALCMREAERTGKSVHSSVFL